MAQSYPIIDYEDMLIDLKDDLEGGFIKKDDTLYIIRQKTPVFCEAFGGEVCPVLDYFYDRPKLLPELKEMTVRNCKELCFSATEVLEENGDDTLKAAVSLIIEDLKDYTAGSPKRNDRPCRVVFEKESLAPMMVYFDDNDAGDEVEEIQVSDLLSELHKCSDVK